MNMDDANEYKVTVEKGLETLIPGYMQNRQTELKALRAALASVDFQKLGQLGHRMRGVGVPYGFSSVTRIGQQIQDGARNGDRLSLEARIAEYADYLSKVQVAYE